MKPPLLAAALLARLLPETERDAILGDLEEEFRERLPRDGARAARRWYRQQAWGTLRMTLSPTSSHDLPPSKLFALGDFLHEVRFAIRQLHRRPLYAGIVVFTLAVGIGATSAVLSVANPILFRPLPFPDPDRLVLVNEIDRAGGRSGVGYSTFTDIRRDIRSLESVAAMSYWDPVLMARSEPEQLIGQSVTVDFFRVLGVTPALGRDFRPEEDTRDNNAVVILSHGLWMRRFGGDPSIVSRPIVLSGREYMVVGILPRSFESLLRPLAQVWRPLGYDESLPWACRTCRHLTVLGRIRPEVSPGEAQAELDQVATRIVRDFPTQYAITGMRFGRLHDLLVTDVKPALLLMLGAGVAVLLIACANVGNLVLARTTERAGELALRTALGAGQWRLLQQLVAESAVLCFAGALGGLILAKVGVAALIGLSPATLPRLDTIRLDWRVTLITLVATGVVTVIIGIAPGFLALRRSRSPGTTRSVTIGRHQRRVTATLVVAEVSLAFMLTAGAGLLTRSLARVLKVDPGFDPANLLTLQVVASGPRYAEDSTVWQMQERLLEVVRNVPGVAQAALSSQIPLGGDVDMYGVRIEDQPLANPEEAPSADRYAVSPGYLEAMRIPIRRGRGFNPEDRAGSIPVVLINESFARLSWPGGDPLGKRVQMESSDTPWRTIVGVVGDVRHNGLDRDLTPQVYVPTVQWMWAENGIMLVVRTRADPAAMTVAVRRAIGTVDPDLAVSDVATAGERIAAGTADRRLVMRLFEVFAGVALVLAAAGIYGLLSRRVAERYRELGIRSALGATRGRILELVLRDGGRLALLGLAAGIVGALATGRLLRRLLFDIAPNDLLSLTMAAGLLGGVALMACILPAWHASRVDPAETLRTE